MKIKELEQLIITELEFYPQIKKRCFSKIEPLAKYIQELLKWGQKTNLVGKKSPIEIFNYLIIDSLFLVQLIEKQLIKTKLNSFLDIGAGAGIPGIPFRIFYEYGQYTMVEPRKKRHVFINFMVNILKLKNTHIYPAPIESMQDKQFDVCLSRAFCNWEKFLNISYPLVKPNGIVIIFSNKKWVTQKITTYNFVLEFPYTLKTRQIRYFWVFSKKAPS